MKKGTKKIKTKEEKVLFISRLIVSIIVIVFALLQLLKIWDKAIYVSAPFLGVVMLIQSLQEWKANRSVAIVSLVCSLFIFICTIVAFCSL